jgi:site-specific DNA-methyltransferase (adenine-specific)
MENLNKIICGDNLEVLKQYNDNTFDLTVFSPPYDNLRDYNGYSFDMHKLGVELYRVLTIYGEDVLHKRIYFGN